MDAQQDRHEPAEPLPPERRPAVNVPAVVLGLIALFALIHAARGLLEEEAAIEVLLTFAFSPARYAPPPELAGVAFPGGTGADIWTFVTHMFLHGDWLHLAVNSLWMLAFGTVIARRLGALRFVLLSLIAAAVGALVNLASYWGELAFLVGASGAISGQMAAALRLMYARRQGLAALRTQDLSTVRALSLGQVLTNRPALIFMSVWVGINLVFGAAGLSLPGDAARIAWEAHIGGFLAGLLLFGLFDPGPRPAPAGTV